MKKPTDTGWCRIMRLHQLKQDEELRIWRERYPHSAPYVQEEAAAIVEKREPKYMQPTARL